MVGNLVKGGVIIFKSFASVYRKYCFSQSYRGSKKINGWWGGWNESMNRGITGDVEGTEIVPYGTVTADT